MSEQRISDAELMALHSSNPRLRHNTKGSLLSIIDDLALDLCDARLEIARIARNNEARRQGIEMLRAMLIPWLEERGDEAPRHDCEFTSNPERGECWFCTTFGDLHEFASGVPQP